ncbi:hypothetical protein A5893_06745 [Pedobacter psychrophilus]|uniref:Uncharacterized protein n=1 Tax=Pedobacter psychrophilus TaxID=1826909 RepID=A0A179DHW4_9SPHI|nr:hypothetical protein [Pedobacter psychrophilus]OAQ40635.1 hypothetical protein A5893_06745 [Pedobacter psychrophilus]
MKTEDTNMNWEKDAPLLASIKKDNPFKVPTNYFEDLDERIQNELFLENLKSNIDNFKTPKGYFENLSQQIINQIKLNEIISEGLGFATPEKYFENTKQQILKSVEPKKEGITRIINLNLIRYAAAACILMMTSFGIYFNIHQSKNLSHQLSEIPDEEIESYLQQNVDNGDVPVIIENLSDKAVFSTDKSKLTEEELIKLLDTTP